MSLSSEEVAEKAIMLLKDVYTNLGPRLQGNQVSSMSSVLEQSNVNAARFIGKRIVQWLPCDHIIVNIHDSQICLLKPVYFYFVFLSKVYCFPC